MITTADRTDAPPASPGGVVIVLGAAVWPGGEASPTLRRRALHGAAVFHRQGAAWLVCTGGIGKHPPAEADVAAALCVTAGVPTACILREDASTTTLENLRFAMRLLPVGPGLAEPGPVTLVTDYYHLPRALLTARMLGLRARGAAPRQTWAEIRKRQHLRMILREALALPPYALRLLWRRWRS